MPETWREGLHDVLVPQHVARVFVTQPGPTAGAGKWRRGDVATWVILPCATPGALLASAPGMIATTALGKEYGARTLFEDVSLQLNAGSRYGLVGANGSGKSTFMRLLAGDEEASEGTVSLLKRARVGVLRQDRFLDDAAIILDLAMRGDAMVWNALAEQRRIADSGDHADAAPDGRPRGP